MSGDGSRNVGDEGATQNVSTTTTAKADGVNPGKDALSATGRPVLVAPADVFQDIRYKYDEVGELTTDVLGYCDEVLPAQLRLVQAFIIEALAKLGWDARDAKSGDALPLISIESKVLPQHKKQFHRLLEVLEAGKFIAKTEPSTKPSAYIRSEKRIGWTDTASEMSSELSSQWPDHRSVHKLVRAVGEHLAECLTGAKDALQLVFGNPENRRYLQEFYERWPLYRTPTLLLGEFLSKALGKSVDKSATNRFRLLEIGAGTGGTTRHLLELFRKRGISVEYYFTDISPSLVEAARKNFGHMDNVHFDTIDIEDQGPEEYRNVQPFHIIIATNCIHATRSLHQSLTHIREMLYDDGVLALIEAVRSDLYFNDLIFGFFEGWWMFEDRRTHALVDEERWRDEMREVGFEEVLWTEGDSPESTTVKVISAFPARQKK